MKKSTKNILRKSHFYVAFVTGLVVFIVSITGCLWVFNKELSGFVEPSPLTYNIGLGNKGLIKPSQAKTIAKQVFPDKIIHGVEYKTNGEAINVIFYQVDPKFYCSVLLHPLSGDVIQIKNHFKGFFAFVLQGHQYLWFPPVIGE